MGITLVRDAHGHLVALIPSEWVLNTFRREGLGLARQRCSPFRHRVESRLQPTKGSGNQSLCSSRWTEVHAPGRLKPSLLRVSEIGLLNSRGVRGRGGRRGRSSRSGGRRRGLRRFRRGSIRGRGARSCQCGIVRVACGVAEAGAVAVLVREEERDEAVAEVDRRSRLRLCMFPEPVGYSILKVVAVEIVVAFEGFDDEEVGREPDGAAPVGVAAEHVGVGFAGGVGDLVALAAVGRRRTGFSSWALQSERMPKSERNSSASSSTARHLRRRSSDGDGEQAAARVASRPFAADADVFQQVRAVARNQSMRLRKPGSASMVFWLSTVTATHGQQADERADAQRDGLAGGR